MKRAWLPPFRGKAVLVLLKQTISEWMDDKAPRLGAALAFYTLFSLAPLVIIFITIAGLVFSNAEGQVLAQIQGLVGKEGVSAVESMIKAAQKPASSAIATTLGLVTLLFGAAGVFVQLKDAMNTVWNVPPPTASGIWAFIKKYFLSFTIVLGIGFLLLVSLLLSAGMALVGEFLKNYLPGMNVLMKTGSFIVSFAIVSCLFATLFKFLPDTKVAWNDVWLGGILTAFLFTIGKFALGIYLGKAGVVSAYGAAGSLVVILLWVYYSAQILFFGAEFTQVFSGQYGSRKTTSQKIPSTYKDKLVAEIEKERGELATTFNTFGIVQFQPRRLDFRQIKTSNTPRWPQPEK